MPPLVSIVIPAYNVAPFIGETLASVFAQTLQDFEIIVVDDGSTDGLARAIEPYRSRLLYAAQPNSGPSAARNHALRLARGRYIALLDGDDIWYPRYLERMTALLAAGYDVAWPDAVFFGVPRTEGRRYQWFFPSRSPVTYERLLKRECLVFVSAMFRREEAARAGLWFDTSLRGTEDFDFWLRLARAGLRFTFTREVLARYRRRPSSLSQDETAQLSGQLAVYEKVLAAPDVTAAERRIGSAQAAGIRRRLHMLAAKALILRGDYSRAAEELQTAARCRPGIKVALAAAGVRLAPAAVARVLQFRETG